MANLNTGSIVWILLAIVSFIIAALALSGVILARDMTGRVIYGVLWTAIGLSWIGRYVVVRRKAEQEKHEDQRS
jgi:hypothetical protein